MGALFRINRAAVPHPVFGFAYNAAHCVLHERVNVGFKPALAQACSRPLHSPAPGMHRTLFTTPIVNTLLRTFSIVFLRLAGWRVESVLPPETGKAVLIAAPHTSNWDLPYTLMVAFVLRLNPYWMGKDTLFKFPFGPVMRWLGVHRSQQARIDQSCRRLGRGIACFRRRVPAHRAARRDSQQDAAMENRVLLHRIDRRCADHHGLHGLPREAQRPRSLADAHWQHRCGHGAGESVLCAVQREEQRAV